MGPGSEPMVGVIRWRCKCSGRALRYGGCTCSGGIMTGTFGQWLPDRPSTLVIACSDGRLQEATDEFLAHHLQVTRYDRFYVPGGAGALAASGRDFLRAQQ